MRDRASAMRSRVLDRFSAVQPEARGSARIDAAITATLGMRDALLDDDHDIDGLHPARTVLILMDDVGVTDPGLLAIGAFLESSDERLAVPLERVAAIDPGAAAAVRSIPTPLSTSRDELLEKLLALPEDLLAAALAERLDHARHFHLRPASGWGDAISIETQAYLPLALRAGGLLARRYERWHSAALDRLRRRV